MDACAASSRSRWSSVWSVRRAGTPARPNPSGNPVARATFSTHQEEVRTDALSIAHSPEERRVGLMGAEALDEDGGMVFVFDGQQDGSFWMKDTLIPLSIAFWGGDGRLLDCPRDGTVHRRPLSHVLLTGAFTRTRSR